MSLKKVLVEGLEAFLKAAEEHKTKKIFVLFTGKEDKSTGKSWCPDCVKADPVIEKNLSCLPENSIFITCIVGDRPTWKDPNNEFRKHAKTHLTGIPTLMQWGTPKKLNSDQCAQDSLVNMLFTDDDE